MINLVDHWAEIEVHEVVAGFSLPVWLTIVSVPVIYLLALAGGYELVFIRMRSGHSDVKLPWRNRLGVARELRGHLRDLSEFAAPWTVRAGQAVSHAEARQAVRDFRASRATQVADEAAARQRLIDFAGVDGTDEAGKQLDQREFEETRDALRWLATCHMGWYQREDGGRYREDLLQILGNDFARQGLPQVHGIVMRVGADGQSWYAYRQTITGWVFAIGASEEPPSQWLYDGDRPPGGYPGRHRSWGKSMFEVHDSNWWT